MKGCSVLLSTLCVFLLSALSAAWPWPASVHNIDALILGRQQQSSSGTSESTSSTVQSASSTGSLSQGSSATSGNSATTTAGGSSATTGRSSATTGSGGGSTRTPTQSSGSSNSNSTTVSKTTAIDPRLPPGGIQMVTPNPVAAASYYKIGDFVTFAWNYTSLSVTPTAIDILASCRVNSAYYTIAMNQTVDPTGAVTWDTGNYQSTATVPLLTETYTLVIYDASKDITASPQAGYLDTFEQFTFGMYSPQPYTPLNEFKCATCSAAISTHERQALSLVVITGLITVLSFTWFASGFGLFN